MTEQEFLTKLVEWCNYCAGEGLFSPELGLDPADILFDFMRDKNTREAIPSYIPDEIARDWIDNK